MEKTRNPQGGEQIFHRFCLIVLTATVLLSCNGEKGSPDETGSIPLYSVDQLASSLPELAAEPVGIFDSPYFMGPYYLEPVSGGRYIASTDRTENRIHLFDETGTHLAKAGGEGRGPGEFMGAIQLHAGPNQDLYALDLRLHRITRFRVHQGELIYNASYPVNLEPGTWLHNIYVTEWGSFGVIRSIVDHSTGEDVYHLYKLDNSFKQAERLLEMPGNEKMSLGEWSHTDHMAGQKTMWDLDGEWFYHISSHSTMINRYNLRTGESAADAWFDLADREITTENRKHLMEYTSNMIRRFPDLRKTMEAVAVLPLFQEFLVHDNVLYLVIFNVSGSERTEIIRINEATGDVYYADIPYKLWRIQAGNGLIYGIETTDEGSSVRIINLAD